MTRYEFRVEATPLVSIISSRDGSNRPTGVKKKQVVFQNQDTAFCHDFNAPLPNGLSVVDVVPPKINAGAALQKRS